MVIEKESPEEYDYGRIRFNLSESSVRDRRLSDFNLSVPDLLLPYGEHCGDPELRAYVAAQSKGLAAHDVLVAAGAAGALFIIGKFIHRREPAAIDNQAISMSRVRPPFLHSTGSWTTWRRTSNCKIM